MNWENFRRANGTIDLVAAAESIKALNKTELSTHQQHRLERIEQLQPIISRQVAAAILVLV